MRPANPSAAAVPSFRGRRPETAYRQAGPPAGGVLDPWCRRIRLVLLGITLFAPAHAAEPGGVPVLQFGDRKQILVDDHIIAGKHLLARRLGRPVKANGGRPVIVDDTPWEDFGVPIVGSVLLEDGRFREGVQKLRFRLRQGSLYAFRIRGD